jgi:SAM-dependent methyltransferase
MSALDNESLWSILACPQCGGKLEETLLGAKCVSCQSQFGRSRNSQLDLRLRKAKKLVVDFVVTPSFEVDEAFFGFLGMDPDFKDLDNLEELKFMSKELPSYIHKPCTKGSLMLDLGCGDAKYRPIFEHSGFSYIGLDYSSEDATLLGDAHALPFRDESFELVFSRSVFEHLQHPIIAMSEAYRVLKPNCRFLGSIAFLEPFHGRSFYHPTHYGLFNYFKHAGFSVECISPNPKWDVLTAQASMSLFPKLPNFISSAVVFPLKLAHKAYWKMGHLLRPNECNELTRLLWTTGSYEFVVRKN